MRIRKDESGQMLVMTALSLVLLMGFVALAIDVGLLFRAQRNMQIAADAAAVAAALDASYSATPNPTSAADASALLNGVTSNYVTMNTPPQFGWHLNTGYYEVIVKTPNPTYFMNVFGFNSINVAARAVAGIVPSPFCGYVQNTTSTGTSMVVKGGGGSGNTIESPGCGWHVNSSSPNALCDQGQSTIDATGVTLVGGQSTKGGCNVVSGYPNAPVSPGGSVIDDPYKNFIGPTSASSIPPCTMDNSTTSIGSTSGYAAPGAGNAVCFSNAINLGDKNGTLKLGSGTYVFLNGVTMTGNVAVTNGTIDVEQGQWTQGNYALSLTAPTAGIYNSLAFMMPSTNTQSTCGQSISSMGFTGQSGSPCLQLQFGSGSGTLDGVIYAPTATVWMQDSGGGTQATGIVAWNLFVNSQLDITSYNALHPSTTPLKTIEMVE